MKTLHLSIILAGTIFATVFGIGIMFADVNAISSTNKAQFQLKVNQTFSIESYGITVKFLNVTSDSRCPSDVTCIWQGEAKVLVNIIENNQDRGNFILSTLVGHDQIVFGMHTLHLIQVNPSASSTKKISDTDYEITLEMSGVNIEPPLKQFKSGIDISLITCRDGLYLAMKSHPQEPLCLKAGTISKLASRGFLYGINTSETNCTTILIPPGSENPSSKNTYSPDMATVVLGVNNTVRWVSQAEAANTIAPDMPFQQDGISFGSNGVIKPGGSYQFTFTEPGTFAYHTEPHPWMKGTIIVLLQPEITISTDKKIYDDYRGIEVSGLAKPMVEGRSLIFTVIEPNGTSYRPDTTGNFHDGKYDTVFSIGMSHWKERGTYKIIVNYGDMSAETSVEFNPSAS